MSATSFDVRTFNRHNDVATALLSAIDIRELEERETVVEEREKAVLRRERAIDRVERLHELRGLKAGKIATPVETPVVAPTPVVEPVAAFVPVAREAVEVAETTEQSKPRLPFQDLLKLREREWWTKVLGIAPTMP